MRRFAAVGLLTVGLMLAGCGAPSEPEPVRTDDAPAPDEGRELPGLAVGETQIGDEGEYRESLLGAVGLEDGRLVVSSFSTDDGEELDAYDSATGELSWQLTASETEHLVSSAGLGEGRLDFSSVVVGPESVFVGYDATRCGDAAGDECADGEDEGARQSGVVALDPADGTPLWGAPVVPDHVDGIIDRTASIDVVDASAEVVLANVRGEGSEDGERVDVAVGLDSRTGHVLWAQQDLVAAFVEGDVVGVSSGSPSSPEDAVLGGLDAGSGERLWTVGDGETGMWAVDGHPRDRLAAAFLPAGELIDLHTGEIITAPNAPKPMLPQFGRAEGGAFAAWAAEDDATVLYSVDDGGEVIRGGTALENGIVQAAGDDGYIWVASDDRKTSVAVDRTGAVRSEPLAGRLLALAEGIVVTISDDTIRLRPYAAD
ncbi:PQQ-binding-like beta-propeller repeat protein [Microbacterium sp. gxy059]|uniref:outer membrane protein assembly factor BamB family protein n=1 Tax=Microbacterium sp. gxy059 TaxID=2957199 RepID=UPI003D99A6F7